MVNRREMPCNIGHGVGCSRVGGVSAKSALAPRLVLVCNADDYYRGESGSNGICCEAIKFSLVWRIGREMTMVQGYHLSPT